MIQLYDWHFKIFWVPKLDKSSPIVHYYLYFYGNIFFPMSTFEKLNLSKSLYRAIADLGFEQPTPIQVAAVPVILSGRDVVGIAQTGTGKTYAYLWPILRDLKYSDQVNPRVLIVVPTRELVVQVVEQAEISYPVFQTYAYLVYTEEQISILKRSLLSREQTYWWPRPEG